MDKLHLSLYGRKANHRLHLAHSVRTDAFLMVGIDGFGREYVRQGREIPQIKSEAHVIASIAGAVVFEPEEIEAETLYQLTNGYRPGTLTSFELAMLHKKAVEYHYPRYEERIADQMHPAQIFRESGLDITINDDAKKAVLNGFDDIYVIYWYEK